MAVSASHGMGNGSQDGCGRGIRSCLPDANTQPVDSGYDTSCRDSGSYTI